MNENIEKTFGEYDWSLRKRLDWQCVGNEFCTKIQGPVIGIVPQRERWIKMNKVLEVLGMLSFWR